MDFQKNFNESIRHFITVPLNTKGELKSEYLKLVKRFHPDANRDIDSKITNEYMVIINYVYGYLAGKKEVSFKVNDEYEKNRIGGQVLFWQNGETETRQMFKAKPEQPQKAWQIGSANSPKRPASPVSEVFVYNAYQPQLRRV